MRRNRKGSLELSIRAIVIVVLALTLLGLGLGFIRGMFRNIGDLTGEVSQQVREQILDDLRRGDKKISFPTQQLIIESNEQEVLGVGIKNTDDQTLNFEIMIQEESGGDFYDVTPGTNAAGTFFWDYTPQTLDVGEARVYGIMHQAWVAKDTYLYKIIIYYEGTSDEYDSKSFFVTVV